MLDGEARRYLSPFALVLRWRWMRSWVCDMTTDLENMQKLTWKTRGSTFTSDKLTVQCWRQNPDM